MQSEDSFPQPLTQIETLSLIQHIKIKFPHHSLDLIVDSIKAHLQVKKQHIEQKQEKKEHNSEEQNKSHQINQLTSNFYERLNNNIEKKNKSKRMEEIQRKQEIRLIAQTYIEGGLNYSNVKDICPSIGPKFYRNTVQAVNNNVIKEMERYLRYQCNIQIEKLNRDQKRSIRTQLTRIRQWLGKRDVAQLQTFYKFIQKKYQLIKVNISIQEALKLYKTILQIVKSPFVDVLQDQIKTQELQTILQDGNSSKDDPDKTLILLFIQHRNLTKISDLLCQKYGYELKWSKHSIKHQMKKILKNSIKKLIACVQAYEDKNTKLFFSQSDKCIDLLASSQNSLDIKLSLLSFYLQKTLTLIQLRQLNKSLNKFFIGQFKDHGVYNFEDMKIRVKIPKLEGESLKQLQKTQISQAKKQEKQQQENVKKQEVLSTYSKKYIQNQIQNQRGNKDNLIDAIGDFCSNFNQNQTNLPDIIYNQNQGNENDTGND